MPQDVTTTPTETDSATPVAAQPKVNGTAKPKAEAAPEVAAPAPEKASTLNFPVVSPDQVRRARAQ